MQAHRTPLDEQVLLLLFVLGAPQVVQYLLSRNYYLTALELLVESQQAGHHEEVEELQVGGHPHKGSIDLSTMHAQQDRCLAPPTPTPCSTRPPPLALAIAPTCSAGMTLNPSTQQQ